MLRPAAVVQVPGVLAGGTLVERSIALQREVPVRAEGEAVAGEGAALGRAVELELVVARDVASAGGLVLEDAVGEREDEAALVAVGRLLMDMVSQDVTREGKGGAGTAENLPPDQGRASLSSPRRR